MQPFRSDVFCIEHSTGVKNERQARKTVGDNLKIV